MTNLYYNSVVERTVIHEEVVVAAASDEQTREEETKEDDDIIDEERGGGGEEDEEEKFEEAPPPEPVKQPASTTAAATNTYYPNVMNQKRMGNITLDNKAFLWEELEETNTTTSNNNNGVGPYNWSKHQQRRAPARARVLWRNVSQHEIQSSTTKDKHLLRIIAKGGNILTKKQKIFKFQDGETLIRINQDIETRMKHLAAAEAAAAEEEEEAQLRGPTNVHEKEGDILKAVRFPFPQAFYDPVTWKLMLDPVVDPAGDSYENDGNILAINVTYYPNRALKSYIESELDIFADIIDEDGGTGASVRGTLLEWGHTMRYTVRQLLEKTAFPTTTTTTIEYKPLPDVFYCPISFDLIHEPVIDPNGHTYEKYAIVHWLRNNNDSPMTRKPLSEDQLRPNNAFLQVLEFLTEEHDDANEENIHPSIRRWKADHNDATIPDIEEGPIASAAPAAPSTAPTATDFTGIPTTVPTNAAPPRATAATPATTRTYASNRQELEDMRHQREQIQVAAGGIVISFAWIAIVIVLLVVFVIPAFTVGIGVLFLIVIPLIVVVPCRMMQQQNTQTVEARRRSIAQNATMNNNNNNNNRRRRTTQYQNQHQFQLQDRQRRARQRRQRHRRRDRRRQRQRRRRR